MSSRVRSERQCRESLGGRSSNSAVQCSGSKILSRSGSGNQRHSAVQSSPRSLPGLGRGGTTTSLPPASLSRASAIRSFSSVIPVLAVIGSADEQLHLRSSVPLATVAYDEFVSDWNTHPHGFVPVLRRILRSTHVSTCLRILK